VLLTRVFATVLLYHFGFLAISLALLGVGGGAIAVYVRPAWFDRVALERQLARWSLAFGGLLAAAAFVIVRLDYPDGVAWAWGINGIASVLASVLAITVAITLGYTAATLVALACYLAALAHAALGRWPDGSPPKQPGEQARERAPVG
jgi:hypothetical protein